MPSTRTCALIRVSTDEQTTDPQRVSIERWARAHDVQVAHWYVEDGVSGAADSRPVLEEMLVAARKGRIGTLVVPALDRLGRRAVRTILTLESLREAGVRVVSLREGLDFGTVAGQLVASVLAHVAEMEREAMRERTRAGLAAARARGATLGRPSLIWTDDDVERLRGLRAAGHSLPTIRREKRLRVFTTTAGAKAVVPSERAMRRALAQTV